jgi:acetyl-CoA acyltransferase
MRDAVIVDVLRTPSGLGKPGGALSHCHPVDLLATILQELVRRNSLDANPIDDVIGGCVTQTGEQSGNVTRHAVLAAGFPIRVPATTIDRQCGSSQQAVHFAAHAIQAGAADIVVACGVESMSRVPMFSNVGSAESYGSLLSRRFPEGLVSPSGPIGRARVFTMEFEP